MLSKSTCPTLKKRNRAFTLVEIMLVVGVVALLAIAGFGVYIATQSVNIQARSVSALNVVVAAQRQYKLDNPTTDYSALTGTLLAPYCPGGVMPTFPTGVTSTVNVYPPQAVYGSKTFVPSM